MSNKYHNRVKIPRVRQTSSQENSRRRQRSANRRCNPFSTFIAAPLVKWRTEKIDRMKLVRGGNGAWFFIAVLLAYWLFDDLKFNLFTSVSSVSGEFFFLNVGRNSVDENEISSVSKHQLHAFTENHVQIFVQVLHSIIQDEGCRKGLKQKYNIAADYHEGRPVIKDDIIFNDLIRTRGFEPQDAQQLIEMSRILFSKSDRGVVRTHSKKGFIYLNDSLLEYCGYKKMYFKDLGIFIATILVIHTVFVVFLLLVRVVIRKCPQCVNCIERNSAELDSLCCCNTGPTEV